MKSNIMKRAWEIYRTLEGNRLAKLSMALRQAWAEVKAMKELRIADWFLNKKAREFGWKPMFSGSVAAIVAETEKAYKIIINPIFNTTTMWVPKSLCKWELTDYNYHETRICSWSEGMDWVREIRWAYC